MARKSYLIQRSSGSQNIPIDITGTVKQMFINSYLKEATGSFKAVRLQNTAVTIKLEQTDIVTDYLGTGIDDFNVLEEKYELSPSVQMQITAKRAVASEAVDPLICLTIVYDKKR